mgnify:CR=1 FL=1
MEKVMNLHDFYYDLPQELIAQDPLSDRSSSRLMVLDKNTGEIEQPQSVVSFALIRFGVMTSSLFVTVL